ncbi:MAG: FecCD family ABC transporter permease, partial [Clostridium sp.]|uniref:FecCD family ABC transporter permease n=1 Tax=Clostridium sp. TaxID=1506 RepID=UPI003EE42D95
MNKKRNLFLVWSIILMVLLIISIILGIAFGSTKIEPSVVWNVLIGKLSGTDLGEVSKATESIIWQIRLPRTILAGITGASLALCGILMQCITKNSIADPYILGISSGASTGAVSVIVFGGSFLGSIGIAGGAFIGAITCGVLVFIIGTSCGKVSSTTRLILSGMALSTIFSALTNLLIYSAE